MAKLLILDDDKLTLSWMSAALSSRGHSVRTFSSAKEALDAVRMWSPQLVISDILMAEMDGISFAHLVRRLEGVPVLFVSIAKKQADAVLAGAIGYVQKPVTAAEVRAAVERVLGRSGRRNTILVVDDDDEIRLLYRSFLEPRFNVLEAENGKVGLSLLGSEDVDLVLLDVHMPLVNGVEMLRRMRDEPLFQEVPVIVQTSDLNAVEAPVWRKLNVSQVVNKLDFLQWLEAQIDEHTSTASPAAFY